MKIVIYGAGKAGKYIYDKICGQTNSKIKVVGFIDNNKTIAYGGLPVWKLEDFFNENTSDFDCIIIASGDYMLTHLMAISLLKHSYYNFFIPNELLFTAELDVLNDEGEFSCYIKKYNQIKPILPYLEYQVVDHCNLNCRGCSHFSNLSSEIFCDKNMFEMEIKKLKNKFFNVKEVRLMGGEPLLYNELPWFVKRVREEFPLSDIHIVTNGLLIPKISEELISVMKNCSTQFDISQYPPTKKMLSTIINFLNDKEIKFTVTNPVEKYWSKFLSDGSIDSHKAFYEYCLACNGSVGNLKLGTCNFLRKGRLFACPEMSMLYENQDFFGFDISQEERDDSSIDIINGNETGWEILTKLHEPVSLCRFCGKPALAKWKNSGNPEKQDWLV